MARSCLLRLATRLQLGAYRSSPMQLRFSQKIKVPPMRPVSLRVALLLALACSAPLASAQNQYAEGGYADRRSVTVGGNISFHIATATSPFAVQIVNLASPFTTLQTISGLVSQARNCTNMWENGCGWPVTTVYTVPTNFTPGYYAARFPTSAGTRNILFVVRPAVPGSYAPIAIIQPTHSDLAYNRFGGKSVYDTISDNGQRAHIVSSNRPYFDDGGLARFNIWEEKFVAWMKAEGRKFEVITDEDMEAGVPLSAYKALLIVGHSEYWSLNARQHLEAYSHAGGHIAIFGANTMWWQVRFNQQTRQMTVYKDAALDPLTGVNNDLVTVNFFDWPVMNQENTILGASFLNAAYVNKLSSSERLPLEERTPYTVRKADHWALAGTGLTNGAQMGRSAGAIEVDGALFNTMPNGDVVVEGSDGTPLSYEVLATLPSSDGYATIGMYVNPQGGAVFNGAARDWAYGLGYYDDPAIEQITRNVLDRLATGAPFAYAPRVTPNRVEERFNTPRSAQEYLPGWRFHRFGLELTAGCAREGALGLQLTGPRWTNVVRNLAVGRNGLSKGAANLWVNADLFTRSATFATTLVAFVDYKGKTQSNVAALEIMIRPEGKALRVASFDGNAYVTTTSWVVLNPGWNSVQFSWETSGMLTLNVGGRKASTFNPKAGQKMTALMLEFAGSQTTGSVCIDHLQFRDAFAPASPATSTITASPTTLLAGGTSTSVVTVQLIDASGNPLVNGGDTVTLATTLGTLSTVTDAGDGTYTATLTPAPASGTATISGSVNGQPITDMATVTFTPPPPPAAPTGLTATAISTTRIDLSWTDNATDETSYRIERCTGSSCTSFAELTTKAANATSHSDTSATHSTTYRYRVIAVNANGDSAPSNIASATTPAPPPPAAPTGLSATVTSPTRIDLSWTDNATDETSYRIERCTGASCTSFAELTTKAANATSHSDTSAAHSTTYRYRVIAVNGNGDSAPSNVATATTPAPPPPAAPTGLSATAISATRIDLAWSDNATDETSYRIERCTAASCTSFAELATKAANATSHSDTPVADGTTYRYRVFAVNVHGDSAPSNIATATTPVACVAPSITTHPQSKTIDNGTTTTLTVAASGTGPLSYQWFAGTTPIGTNSSSITVTPTATTTYSVRVSNDCGSADSNTATVTVVGPPGNSFYVITPCRVLDTRSAPGPQGGPALGSGQTRVVQITGTCGIPAGATAVAMNVTAVFPSSNGFLAFYPTGTTWPGTTTVNYRTAKTRATSSLVALSANGQGTVLNEGSTLHFIVDVTGYFQ